MTHALDAEPTIAEVSIAHLLTRKNCIAEDLVDQLFNSRARTLLLANVGRKGVSQPIETRISHETLAEMVGTTGPPISFFMNKFRRLGLIDYDGHLQVQYSLLRVVLRD